MHFIDFFVVEMKRFVDSSVTVFLTRQTCGQRSSRAKESKRRALENKFSEQICYMSLILKCRGDWDLGPCNFWILARRNPLHKGDFRRKNVLRPQKKIGIWHCAAVQKVHRLRSKSVLHFKSRNIFHSKKWVPSAWRFLLSFFWS